MPGRSSGSCAAWSAFCAGASAAWATPRRSTPKHLNTPETLRNAKKNRKRGEPLRIAPEDFSVQRVEYSTASETVLCIDVSYSMLMNDALHAGKKGALGLT